MKYYKKIYTVLDTPYTLQPMNYIQFKYLKPTKTYTIVYILILDSHPHEETQAETLDIGGNQLVIPWILLGAEFIAGVN